MCIPCQCFFCILCTCAIQPYHPDLNANFASTGGDFVNMAGIHMPGPLRHDPSGHGTHVAGIVGAVGNNEIGIAGVNWNVLLVPMQVKRTSGVVDDVACIRAINYASNTWSADDMDKRINILNFSIGSDRPWPNIEPVIRQFNGLFVCSTGNIEQNNDEIHHYPSFYASDMHTDPLTNMISVGRSDINDQLPTDANWSARTIAIYAPGHNIVSTWPLSLNSNFGFGYHIYSGSSMAAPHVAGVAALLLSRNPYLSAAQLRNNILSNADIITIDTLDGPQVVRRLNAYRSLSNIFNPPQNLQVTTAHNGTMLWWQSPITAGNSGTLSGYRVERRMDGEQWEIISNGLTQTRFNDTDVLNSETYSYRVVATYTNVNGVSEASNEFQISLPCVIVDFPYLQDFEEIPVHWSRATGLLSANSEPLPSRDSTWSSGPWRLANFIHNSAHENGQSARATVSGNTSWLISPPLSLDQHFGTYMLTFDAALRNANNQTYPPTPPIVYNTGTHNNVGIQNRFVVLISTDDGQTWSPDNIIAEWNNAGLHSISSTGETITLTLPKHDDVVKIAFYVEGALHTPLRYFFIDNVNIDFLPAISYFP